MCNLGRPFCTSLGLLLFVQVNYQTPAILLPMMETANNTHARMIALEGVDNVRVEDKNAALESEAVKAAVRAAEEALGDDGRVLLRPSGTEPVVRVMVEAKDDESAKRHAEAIANAIQA